MHWSLSSEAKKLLAVKKWPGLLASPAGRFSSSCSTHFFLSKPESERADERPTRPYEKLFCPQLAGQQPSSVFFIGPVNAARREEPVTNCEYCWPEEKNTIVHKGRRAAGVSNFSQVHTEFDLPARGYKFIHRLTGRLDGMDVHIAPYTPLLWSDLSSSPSFGPEFTTLGPIRYLPIETSC